ncbi:peroxiredoxin [Sphingomonas nostoxanthinifaciens]|uniref:peroxiredoxin n=1 Tax=Sphingomonas nostoxanthinifaciens TaxID=2872652 RepID=UPI001CC1C758|nr:peroxiredoxin [Sphingomonas nostoxanthinifaciens]UAK23549.1 peroxiredoxin [Sphingomonas nostoxanthinifaciens]
MTIQPGDKVPDITLVRVCTNGPDKIATGAYFKGRRIVLFSVPGAFTPTCSAKHLPGFITEAEAFKDKGVDEIVCTAVNDPFVMAAWAKASAVDDRVTLLADGNGEFVRALGLDMDCTGFGLGMRGRRFAMIVGDGTVEQLFVEAPGEFEVSAAEYVLARL